MSRGRREQLELSGQSRLTPGPPTPGSGEHDRFVHLAVARAIDRGSGGPDVLTYADGGLGLQVGERCVAPLGNGTTDGVVVRVGGAELLGGLPPERARPVSARASGAIPADLVRLAWWVSDYYLCPIGMTLASVVPAAVKHGIGIKRERKLKPGSAPDAGARLPPAAAQALERVRGLNAAAFPIDSASLARLVGARNRGPINALVKSGHLEEIIVERVRAARGFETALQTQDIRHDLNAEQHAAAERIAAGHDGFAVHLLHGVTGSGKTEVYLRAIERVLAAGRSAVVLVPEIALTPQTAGRFLARFKEEGVAVLHSGLSASARHEQWSLAASGRARVVIGARSAVFAPVPDLGLIVVDEEHDSSYKQDQAPRYHARDVAVVRAQQAGCGVVLGSATPSLESWSNARAGRYTLHTLSRRATGAHLPPVTIVDAARFPAATPTAAGRGLPTIAHQQIGPELGRALQEVIGGGDQAILLLNRRGAASVIVCPDRRCGWRLLCDSCDAGLVAHRRAAASSYVRCHHCLAEAKVPRECPICKTRLVALASGTQRLEDEITEKFGPGGRVADLGLVPGDTLLRADSDAMRSAADYFALLQRFASGEARVIAGTQMIAKGLDFPGVRLVGVISADTALGLPDFRADERTFQLVSQVAGRAGRGAGAGRVIVQTCFPESGAIQRAARHDFVGFADAEMQVRAAAELPPAWKLARIVSRHTDALKAQSAAAACAEAARQASHAGSVRVEGPMPCTIARLQEHHRFEVRITGRSAGVVQRVLQELREAGRLVSDARIAVDVDPTSLL